ncbi:MAG: MoaD/ThiS family protein [Planctomycetes bacterium]|nr:MoaD/ThiS family protein [Planctomycetota bacterium]
MSSVNASITLVIPSALSSLCRISSGPPSGTLRISADSVRGALAELARQFPDVHVRLCDERGNPRPHINVFVNDDHVRTRAGLDTPLAAGDTVSLLPAVSGG